jgi:hypothetical protein
MPALDTGCPQRGSRPYLRGRHILGRGLRPQSPIGRGAGSRNPGIAPGKKRKLGESRAKFLEEDLHARLTVGYEERGEFLHKLLR